MSWLLDDDICWCADSDECENKNCFRHTDNMPGPGLYTMGNLMGTEYCPLNEEGE